VKRMSVTMECNEAARHPAQHLRRRRARRTSGTAATFVWQRQSTLNLMVEFLSSWKPSSEKLSINWGIEWFIVLVR
jgi:hypothetical protein